MSEFEIQPNPLVTEETIRISKELQFGAGTSQFRANKDGVFLGGDNYNDAVLKFSYTGNLMSGKTAYTDDTNAGFWLGSVSGTPKMNIGASATKYFHYDGSDLTMLGGTITGGILQTASSGYRVKVNGGTNKIELLSDNTVLSAIFASAGGDLILDSTDDVNFALGGTIKCYVASGAFKPNSDKAYDLGASGNYWNNGYIDDLHVASSLEAGGHTGLTQGFQAVTRINQTKTDGVVTNVQTKKQTMSFSCGLFYTDGSESGWEDAE